MDRKSSRSSTNRPGRSKKRKFTGNRYTGENDTSTTIASAAKIAKKDTDFEVNIDQTISYDIINFSLFLRLQSMVICKTCQQPVRFYKRSEKGLGFLLSVQCECEDEIYIPSSPQIRNTYEINRRFVFVMRLLGVGLHGIKTFLGLMDIGQGFTGNSYHRIIDHIWIAADAVSQLVFRKTAKEEQEKNPNETKNHLSVSSDGSWAKRGFSSLVGVTSLIGKYTGKIIDIIVKSDVCKSCEQWTGKEDTVEYAAWYETHTNECIVNYLGSTGCMEVDSIIEMFQRSMEKFKVYYKYYVGDKDTNTFKSLQDAQPYGDDLIVEKEDKDLSSENLPKRCVGVNTQNNNESYNDCVWQIVPKHIFSGNKIVEIAAFCAASVFNEGFQPIVKMMETMGVLIGVKAINFVKRHEEERIFKAERMSYEGSKEQSVARRNARLQGNEYCEETEGILYGAGIAD